MKTSVQTLFASALVAICLSATAFTASAAQSNTNPANAAFTPAIGIQKIVIKGNAKILLVQSEKESVKVYEAFNNDKTTIKMDGGTLVINSNEEEPINITVYVKDLFRIEASNTASVYTKGTLHLQFLQVILNDKAKANINACTKGLYTVTKDSSKLKLAGTTDEHIMIRSRVSTLQLEGLASLKTNDSFLENQLAQNSSKSVIFTDLSK